ncbi:MAG: methylenetetrahydrofolate reductase [Chloroflexota bacterium]|jgi:methylenetetrahydrofolate reductase (NADPH)|nr:methylenetetrahydrofolate reductase [Chloroflexota bacterium]
MKIRDLFASGRRLFSFEFFPPKTPAGMLKLEQTIGELRDLAPAFVSVTYGAGGSTRDLTVELVTRIQRNEGICAMAHLTCVGAGREEIASVVDRLVDGGIENIIALRGDPPAGAERFETPPDGFAHAADLVAFIRQRHGDRLCLAGACYPEGHLECRDLDNDMRHLLTKVRAGVDFIVTQLFYDNRHYFDFVRRAREAGVTVPIVPGIMPIVNFGQIERITRMSGAALPAALFAELDRRRDDPAAAQQLGVAQATAQCVDLLEGGAPGIHFYTLNQSPATRMILTALKATRLA